MELAAGQAAEDAFMRWLGRKRALMQGCRLGLNPEAGTSFHAEQPACKRIKRPIAVVSKHSAIMPSAL